MINNMIMIIGGLVALVVAAGVVYLVRKYLM